VRTQPIPRTSRIVRYGARSGCSGAMPTTRRGRASDLADALAYQTFIPDDTVGTSFGTRGDPALSGRSAHSVTK
jgi:hypothetical protein